MDDLTRQIVILLAVMTCLSIITYFLINVSETPSTPSLDITTPEFEAYTGPGSGVLNQSLYGLNLLYHDLNSFRENESETND